MASEDQQVSLIKLSDVKSTGKLIGKGAYGRVIEVYVHGMPCAAKEVHSILIENVTPNEFEATKASFLNECAKSSRIKFILIWCKYLEFTILPQKQRCPGL